MKNNRTDEDLQIYVYERSYYGRRFLKKLLRRQKVCKNKSLNVKVKKKRKEEERGKKKNRASKCHLKWKKASTLFYET